MTVNISNTGTTNTFEYWRNRTNELAFASRERFVSVSSNTATGNASVDGTFSGGVLLANNTTTASNTTTGALQVRGGVGVKGTVHVGNTFTIAGEATFNAGFTLNSDATVAANINFNDGEAAAFGTGQDMAIYHDGTDGYIKEQGVGGVKIQANTITIEDEDGSDTMLEGISGGAVRAYYNNSAKFETNNTGVNVTGEANTTTLKVSSSTDFNGNVVFTDPSLIQFDDGATANNKFLRVNSTGTGVEYANASLTSLSEINNVTINQGTLANAHVLIWSADDNDWRNVPRALIDASTVDDINGVKGSTSGNILVKVTGASGLTGTSNGFVSGKLTMFSQDTFTSQTGNTLSFTSTTDSQIQVFVNGSKLVTGTDYVSNTTSINLVDNLDAADVIEVVEFDPNSITAASGTVTDSDHSSYSDIRLKTNIIDYTVPESIYSLRPIQYDFNEVKPHLEGKTELGVIAQDLEEIESLLIREDPDGFKMVDYPRLTVMLLAAVQDLKHRVDRLEGK